MPPPLNLDPAQLDLNHVVADHEAIRKVNPQRFEMEQLHAIVYLDAEQGLVAGYCDVRPDAFWVRGHMPGYPLMPGVVMCEAAAQLCSFLTAARGLNPGDFVGLAGMENVRFRGPVRPGDRLVLTCKVLKFNRRQSLFNVQGFVGSTMVFHVDIIGVPIHRQPAPAETTSPPVTAGQES